MHNNKPNPAESTNLRRLALAQWELRAVLALAVPNRIHILQFINLLLVPSRTLKSCNPSVQLVCGMTVLCR